MSLFCYILKIDKITNTPIYTIHMLLLASPHFSPPQRKIYATRLHQQQQSSYKTLGFSTAPMPNERGTPPTRQSKTSAIQSTIVHPQTLSFQSTSCAVILYHILLLSREITVEQVHQLGICQHQRWSLPPTLCMPLLYALIQHIQQISTLNSTTKTLICHVPHIFQFKKNRQLHHHHHQTNTIYRHYQDI